MSFRSYGMALVCISVLAGPIDAQDTVDTQDTTVDTDIRYELQYKFAAGEEIRYHVEQMATVDTTISGHREISKSTTKSTKLWVVESVEGRQATFTHSIEDVAMRRKDTGRDEVVYNSREDAVVPKEYQPVADKLGKTLAEVTIDEFGQIVKKESSTNTPDLGFGSLVVPLPQEPVAIGFSWTVPSNVKLSLDNGLIKNVKTQVRYRLEKVKTGVATISMVTQILTPVNDPKLKSQLIQKTSSGEIKFDIDAGRVMSKRLDWDENVIGFNGPASNMKYLARFTESLVDSRTAQATIVEESR